MGPRCLFITGDHPVPPGGVTFDEYDGSTRPIVVETDVFTGARVTVMPGVTIGGGTAVAAGAVVTRDVAAETVVGGVPAKVLSKR